jgi:hypothetical protein
VFIRSSPFRFRTERPAHQDETCPAGRDSGACLVSVNHACDSIEILSTLFKSLDSGMARPRKANGFHQSACSVATWRPALSSQAGGCHRVRRNRFL